MILLFCPQARIEVPVAKVVQWLEGELKKVNGRVTIFMLSGLIRVLRRRINQTCTLSGIEMDMYELAGGLRTSAEKRVAQTVINAKLTEMRGKFFPRYPVH